MQVCYGVNDIARFSSMRGSCLSQHASALMRFPLEREAANCLCTWYARVRTEANVPFRTRNVPHHLFPDLVDESTAALVWFEVLMGVLQRGHAG